MVYNSLDQTRLDYKDPLHEPYAAKKLNHTEGPTDRPTDIPISRAPMELKIVLHTQLTRFEGFSYKIQFNCTFRDPNNGYSIKKHIKLTVEDLIIRGELF